MGGHTTRAILGGALVVVTLAFAAGELGAGPAGASRERTTQAKLDKLHQRRPAAAARARRDQLTPVAVALGVAAEHDRATQATLGAIVRYVSALQLAAANEQAAAAAQAAPAWSGAPAPASESAPSGGGGGGGDVLACIRAHESDSSGGYSAVNSGSGAGGAYQALPSTWDGYAGYGRAEDAPPEVQDQWASDAVASSGTAPWAGSGC